MSDKQLPKALQLAAMFDYPLPPDWGEMQSAAAELRRLHQHELAHIEWIDKTEWVRQTARPGELGMHRADVLKQRIEHLKAELEQARAALAAQGEPVGEVFTMEALGTPGKPFCHVLLNKTLPTGTKLYTAAPAKPMTGAIQQDSYKQADGSKNCMQCSVAYLLGLPTSDVPDFEQAGPDAWDSFYSFISDRGFTAEMFPPTVEIYGDYLASGYTTRGTSHMVVMRGGELLHDPHPSNDGLKSVQVVWVIARKAPRCITDKGGA